LKSALFITASAFAIGGGLYAGGILSSGEVYDLPVADVRARLMSLPLSPEVLKIAGGSDSSEVDVVVGSSSITWSIPTGGPRAATFTAKFRAEGPSRTRVTVGYANGVSPTSLEDRLTSTKFLRSYAESSFAEEVDARLDGRPVDQAKAQHDFALRVAADPEQIRELGRASQSMFKDVASQMTDTSAQPDDIPPSTQSTDKTMKAATRPSAVLPDRN
jgi:hypothetical protein